MDIISSLSFSMRPTQAYKRLSTRATRRITPSGLTDAIHPDAHFALFEQLLAAMQTAFRPETVWRKAARKDRHRGAGVGADEPLEVRRERENTEDESVEGESTENENVACLAQKIAALNQEEEERLLKSTGLDVTV